METQYSHVNNVSIKRRTDGGFLVWYCSCRNRVGKCVACVHVVLSVFPHGKYCEVVGLPLLQLEPSASFSASTSGGRCHPEGLLSPTKDKNDFLSSWWRICFQTLDCCWRVMIAFYLPLYF